MFFFLNLETKESPGSNEHLVSFFKNRDRQQQQQSDPVRDDQEYKRLPDLETRSRTAKASESAVKLRTPNNPECEDDSRLIINPGIVKDRSSRYNIRNDATPTTLATATRPNTTPTSSFLHQASSAAHSSLDIEATEGVRPESSGDAPPKPIRRTQPSPLMTRQPTTAPTSKEQTFSGASTSSSVATSSLTNACNKRITNPRQNHGRAVAPPQLPGSALIRLDSNLGESASLAKSILEMPYNDVTQLASDDGAIDFNQSPIAQRLLKQSKDCKGSNLSKISLITLKLVKSFQSSLLPVISYHSYTTLLVSELNSPYESENEHSKSTNPARSQKLYRGIKINQFPPKTQIYLNLSSV